MNRVALSCRGSAAAIALACLGSTLPASAQPANPVPSTPVAPARPGAISPPAANAPAAGTSVPPAAAQPGTAAPPAAGAPLTLTPPVAPRIQETPLPPPVALPPPPAAAPPDVPNRPLTADEAALVALHHQPTVTEAGAGIEAARGRTQQVRSGLRPTLGVIAGYSHVESIATENGGPSGGGSGTGSGTVTTGGGGVTVSGYQAAGTLRQLIFDFNHTRDLVRQGVALERAAAANLTRVQSDLVLQVKQAFYTMVQNQRLVGVNETNVRNQQAHLALAQARLHSGLGLPSDVVRAQTGVADAILNLNVAQNNASVSRVNLALLLGIDPRTPIQPAETGEPAVAANDVNALVQTALTQRPDIRQFRENLRATEYEVNAAKTTNAPAVVGSLSASTRGADFPPGNDFFTIGLNIVWTPFDGGLTSGRVREARANHVAAQSQLTGVQLTVTSDVSRAYLTLRTAEQQVTTADAGVVNAEEGVRLAEGRYRAGIGTFIDVTDAQAALVTAQTNRVNTQSVVEQARAAVAHAIGAPLPAPAR